MGSQLSVLIGRYIVAAASEPGNLGLGFGDASLSINNPVTVVGIPPEDLPAALEGLALKAVTEHEQSVTLHFNGGVTLEVDLRDEAYTGPEAMVLVKPTGEFVVWN